MVSWGALTLPSPEATYRLGSGRLGFSFFHPCVRPRLCSIGVQIKLEALPVLARTHPPTLG